MPITPAPVLRSARTLLKVAGPQGLEPQLAESKSAVLTITQWAIENGRRGGIRTPDGLLPKQVHYQAVLRAENNWLAWVESNNQLRD